MSYLDLRPALGETTPAHAGGDMGERDAAFELGRRGFEIIIGPGGPGGHGLTERGFDIVAYNPRTGQLWIVDNKASGGTGRAYEASAITRNLAQNLADAARRVRAMPPFPHQQAVLAQLSTTFSAVRSGRPIPPTVSRIVTNAGGYLRGIGSRLARQGIRFVDVTGAATRAARQADILRARASGVPTGRSTRHAQMPALPAATARATSAWWPAALRVRARPGGLAWLHAWRRR